MRKYIQKGVYLKEKFLKFNDQIKLSLLKILNYHKGWLVIFFAVFLLSFITGIMTCVHYLDVVTYENLINEYLIKLLTKDSTYLTFFLMMLLWFCVVTIACVLLTKNLFFVIVDFVILGLMVYVWGFDLCIIVMTLGLAGVIYGVLLLGVLGLLIFFVIVLVLSVACKKFFITKNICDNEVKRDYFRLFLVLIFCGTAVLFVMSLLFSSIHIFVIVD